jgi:hypothetical protein
MATRRPISLPYSSPVTANRSTWNQAPYSAEMDFYRREDTRRWQARQVLAQQQQYRQQRRDEARRDSLERVALRRIWSADSMRSAVMVRMDAQVDSVERVHAVALAAAPKPAMATRAVATRARTTSTHATVTKKKVVAVKRSTGPTVYYCASGNTVKYHASSGCRGLWPAVVPALILSVCVKPSSRWTHASGAIKRSLLP